MQDMCDKVVIRRQSLKPMNIFLPLFFFVLSSDIHSDYNQLPAVQTVNADFEFEIVALPVQVFHCLEVYTENKHELDLVDTTYSCGNTRERMQFTLKELQGSSGLYALTQTSLF